MPTRLLGGCLIALVFYSSLLPASDYEKEKRWAEQISDALLDGEPVYLDLDDHRFLAIHTEPPGASDQAVIIMHGTGVHPDWQTVIYPLRVGLAEQGFHTLSIQMPILANDAAHEEYAALFPQVPPRIDSAAEYLVQQGIQNVYLIGHSLGAAMGNYYLGRANHTIRGFVAIGMSNGIKNSVMDNVKNLKSVTVPMLDLYGSEDLDEVVSSAPERNNAASSNNAYSQIVVQGADHFFDGEEGELLARVLEWLQNWGQSHIN